MVERLTQSLLGLVRLFPTSIVSYKTSLSATIWYSWNPTVLGLRSFVLGILIQKLLIIGHT